MFKRIKGLVFDNFLIKLFSVIFAVLLWLHVVARGKSEVNFVVPLELRDIPDKMVVVGDVPGYADVRLQGQEGIVKGLSPKDISVFVSLSDAKEGEQAYSLAPANVNVPGNISVVMVTPPQIRLRLEPLASKALIVKPDLLGKPADGYRLEKVEIAPETVRVQGPASFMKRVQSVATEAVDIQGASQSFARQVSLVHPPEKGVKLEEESVRVWVTLKKTRR